MGSEASYELMQLLTSICFCTCHLISIFISAYLMALCNTLCCILVPISCKAGPLGASDNTVSSLVIIVVVTQIQGEPSQKASLCFEESGLLFFSEFRILGFWWAHLCKDAIFYDKQVGCWRLFSLSEDYMQIITLNYNFGKIFWPQTASFRMVPSFCVQNIFYKYINICDVFMCLFCQG